MRRCAAAIRFAAAALCFLGALAAPAQAQKVYRIGYLTGSSAAAFKEGMREHGYVEGRHFRLEARFANGNFGQLPSLADQLARSEPDLLLVSTTPASLAAKKASTTLPIVFVGVADPLGVGLVASLARPGGNITGITNIVAELTGKRLGILKDIMPGASRIAILVNPDDPNAQIQIRNAQEAARTLGVELGPVLNLRRSGDLKPAFEAAARAGADAALRMVDPTTSMLRAQTVALAVAHRMPVMYAFREDAEAGGLAAYGTNLGEQYRQAAGFVDKILRGAKPGDLPVEQPTKFDFVINVATAKALGLSVPPALLLQAQQISP